MHKPEEFMVFKTSMLRKVGYFSGIHRDVEKYYTAIIKDMAYTFMQRSVAEENIDFKQVIPYIIIKNNNRYLSYQRGKLLSEKRLLAKFSIGFGGHVQYDEAAMTGDYTYSLRRELKEELNVKEIISDSLIGVINDDSDAVGKVHFGFVHELLVGDEDVRSNEKSINKLTYYTLEELKSRVDEYENWSRFVIESL